jgi:hypothetical protein
MDYGDGAGFGNMVIMENVRHVIKLNKYGSYFTIIMIKVECGVMSNELVYKLGLVHIYLCENCKIRKP